MLGCLILKFKGDYFFYHYEILTTYVKNKRKKYFTCHFDMIFVLMS